ncbi:hypothetical protein Mapa_012479 [Marchantia paleacea]|nr:hypothetical protein Mapa_012479 [Marchantia paleacea]
MAYRMRLPIAKYVVKSILGTGELGTRSIPAADPTPPIPTTSPRCLTLFLPACVRSSRVTAQMPTTTGTYSTWLIIMPVCVPQVKGEGVRGGDGMGWDGVGCAVQSREGKVR